MEGASIEKILEVDSHIGAAMSGLIADARTMIDHARVEAQAHRFTYDEPISVESVTQAVCDLSLKFGEDRSKGQKENLMSRPFGVALLLAGIDEEGPHLYHTDPSGTFSEWTAKVVAPLSPSSSSSYSRHSISHYHRSFVIILFLTIFRPLELETKEPKLCFKSNGAVASHSQRQRCLRCLR